MTCTHRSKRKPGGLWCRLYDKAIANATCESCSIGNGTRKHVRGHDNAKHSRRPLRQGEGDWLRSLGVPVPKRPSG